VWRVILRIIEGRSLEMKVWRMRIMRVFMMVLGKMSRVRGWRKMMRMSLEMRMMKQKIKMMMTGWMMRMRMRMIWMIINEIVMSVVRKNVGFCSFVVYWIEQVFYDGVLDIVFRYL
jgi:hypothetical protein